MKKYAGQIGGAEAAPDPQVTAEAAPYSPKAIARAKKFMETYGAGPKTLKDMSAQIGGMTHNDVETMQRKFMESFPGITGMRRPNSFLQSVMGPGSPADAFLREERRMRVLHEARVFLGELIETGDAERGRSRSEGFLKLALSEFVRQWAKVEPEVTARLTEVITEALEAVGPVMSHHCDCPECSK